MSARRTGRTTRMLWRALLRASENAEARIAVIASTEREAERIFRYLLDLATPIGLEFAPLARELILPNHATIRVLPPQRPLMSGLRYLEVFEDAR